MTVSWRRIATIVVFGAATGSAFAVAPTGLGLSARDANAAIEVFADSFLADIDAKSGTYTGNVIVKQGDFRLRANTVRVNVTSGKPDKIVASGNVVFDAPSGNAQGDNGVYDVGPHTITLSGHVILAKDSNVMRGTSLTVNLQTGTAQLFAKDAPGGRVQGLFTPPAQPQKVDP